MKVIFLVMVIGALAGCASTRKLARFVPSELLAFKESEIRTRTWKEGEDTLSFAELQVHELNPQRAIAVATYKISDGTVHGLDIYLRADWGNAEKGFYLICHDRRRSRIVDVTLNANPNGLIIEVNRKTRYSIAGSPWTDGINRYFYHVEESGEVREGKDFYFPGGTASD